MKDKLVSIIIVNYNNHEYTLECLNSLKNQFYRNFEVILLDNGSIYNIYLKLKEEIELLKDIFHIKIIRNEQNFFFAAGNNKAIKTSNGQYICLLNNDTVVSEDFIEKMVEFCENSLNIGMISPKIKVYNHKNYLWYAGADIDFRKTNIAKLRGFWEYDKSNDKYNKIRKTDYAAGTALFLRKSIIDQIGLLDEIFFMYYEETDWNFRAYKNGYFNFYVPNTIVYHKVPLKNSNINLFKWYFLNRNSQIIVWKYAKFFNLMIFYFKFFIKNLFFFLKFWEKKDGFYYYIQLFSIYQGFRIGRNRRTNRTCKKYLIKDYRFIIKNQKRMQNSYLR